METGICKLCLLRADLCDSHYMPGATYKYSRATELKNPHPVMLTGETPKQGTDQVRDYAFCQKCENLFRVNGETWVLANIPHDYGAPFPLRAAATASIPAIMEPKRILIAGKATKGFDMDKLIYFGASIFWRGAAHQWKPINGYEIPTVRLGVHQEQLRLFLRGESGFPTDVSLSVMLFPYDPVPPGFLLPSALGPEGEKYWFYITGLGFILDLGANSPIELRKFSTSHSPEQFVTIDEQFGDMVWKEIKQVVPKDLSAFAPMLKEIDAIRSKKSS
jgi:hypothetical protein